MVILVLRNMLSRARNVLCIFTGSIARSAKRRYLSYPEADFEVFHLAGATRCTDGGEIWHGGLRVKFHPHRCNDQGIGPPKLKNFYWDLTKMWNINAPQGRILCVIFTSFAQNSLYPVARCVSCQNSLDLLKGLWSYGFLSWGGLVTPRFSAPPSGETMHHTPKSFSDARTRSRSSITVPSLVGLGFHPPPGRPKALSFLFVYLFVTLLNVRVCAPDFAMKALEYRNDFDAIG